MGDLPLLMAQRDYIAWVEQMLLATGEAPSMPFPREKTANAASLRFGDWYYGIGKTRYGHLAEFSPMDTHHLRALQMGPEIMRLHGQGKTAQAHALCRTLAAFNDQVLACLEALQMACARENNVPPTFSAGTPTQA